VAGPKVEYHTVESHDNPNDATPNGYGTCAASIAYGHTGIMIQGTLVSMKAWRDSGYLFLLSDYLSMFTRAIDDIVEKKRQGRSVININSKSIIYHIRS
jgi:hypothetical protein